MKRSACLYLFFSTLFILAGIVPRSAAGQAPVLINDDNFRVDAQVAIDSLYNRNEEAARDILEPWMESYPEHPLWTLWSGMELWWSVLADLENRDYDEQFFNKMKRADYEASQLLRKSPDHPDALIIRAIANGYTARHYSNREEWLTAANIGRRAYQAYARLMEVVPNLPDNDFAEGMKRYYAAYIPDNYPAVRAVSWFLPDGDRQGGLDKLAIASENGVFARPEATYFLGNIYLNYEEDYESALTYFRQLVDQYPKNGYYRRLYARTLAQLRQYDELIGFARETLDYRGLTDEEGNTILHEEIYYWLGRAQYHSGRPEDSVTSFEKSYQIGKALPNSDDRPIQALSAYYAGRAYETLSNHNAAENYYEIVLRHNNNGDVKQRAKDRLKMLR